MKLREIWQPLTAILITAGILAGGSALLAPIRERNEAAERMETMQKLLPEGENFVTEELAADTREGILAAYRSRSGYVIETAVKGYADEIVLWVGVDNSGTVTGITVRDLAETRGLGGRALRDGAFLEQFLGTKGNAQIGSGVDALSGATVTSKAIAKGVNAAVGYVTGTDVGTYATEWGKQG